MIVCLQESHSEQQYKNKHNNSGGEFKGEQTEISFIKFRNRKFWVMFSLFKKKIDINDQGCVRT